MNVDNFEMLLCSMLIKKSKGKKIPERTINPFNTMFVHLFYEIHMFYKRKHNSNKISNMWVPPTCPAGL